MYHHRKREQQEDAELYAHNLHGAVDEGDGGPRGGGDGGLAAARQRAMEGFLAGGVGGLGLGPGADAKRRAMGERNMARAQVGSVSIRTPSLS